MNNYQAIINFIQTLYNTKEFIPLHEPRFLGNEKKYLIECIDSTFVSSVGAFVDRFEKEFALYVGSKYAIATVNGTAALHTALLLANVDKDDEVITQALSFVATPNAISYTGAKPIFLDVDLDTMGLSPEAFQNFLQTNCELKEKKCINKTTNRVIKACIPMHTFGHPCRIDEIAKLCREWHITLIEDSAESLGSFYKGQHTGTFGEVGIFSFNGNKIITSGGGGVIVTDDETLAKRAKHLTTTAKVPHKWEYEHDEIGYNYRMPNLNAALLVAQLENLENFLADKRTLAKEYKKFFKSIEDISFIEDPDDAKSNYWLNVISVEKRDETLKVLNENGIMSRPVWRLLSDLEIYKECQSDELSNSRYLESRLINIPSGVRL